MQGASAASRSLILRILCAAVLAALALASAAWAAPHAPAACSPLSSADQIPDATLITFDDLPDGANIGNHYQAGFGVTFEDSRTARVKTAALRDGAHSPPNVARSEALGDPATTALNFYFDSAKAYVGLFLGNGGGATTARLEGFDADGALICTAIVTNVPDGHAAFIGFHDDAGQIVRVALTYFSAQAESLDDLHFSAAAAPTATPTFTRTPTRTPTPTATQPASPTPALFLFPAAVAPGGEPAVGGYGFPTQADLRLILACPSSAELDLGGARTDAAGRLQTTVIAPAFPPNPCLLAARQGRTNLAEAALTLRPALQLTFSPQTGPPGTTVNFTARNLVAGELRLDYAGRAVFGPAAVAAGSFSGAFTIPGDRPDPLGEMAELQATNLVLGRKAATASETFASQAGPTPPDYRVADLQLPIANLPPSSDFSITGRISPAPQGPLSQFRVLPVWKKADGRTLPIGRGPAQIATDGSFSVPARVPSLLAGDPTWPELGDLVGVMLVTPGDQPQPFLQAVAGLPIFPTFNVKVVDAATKQLIPAAKVSFEAWQSYAVSAGSLGELAGQAATGISNQIGQVMGTTELTDDELAQMALMKLLCMPQPIPVNSNKWELINPTLDQTISQPAVQGLVQGNSVIIESAGVVAADLSPAAGQVGVSPICSRWMPWTRATD